MSLSAGRRQQMLSVSDECLRRFSGQAEYEVAGFRPAEKPVITASVITYQQAPFIRDCLDGILRQIIDVPIEVIVGEDGSTDGTREICIEYARQYPGLVRLFLRNRVESQLLDEDGRSIARFNGTWNRLAARGEYIALCEGDDYWTDPLKLARQLREMEHRPQLSYASHDATVLNPGDVAAGSFNRGRLTTGVYGADRLLREDWCIPTASLFMRRAFLPSPYPDWFFRIQSADVALQLMLASLGDFYYDSAPMAAYRRNAPNSLSVTRPSGLAHARQYARLMANYLRWTPRRDMVWRVAALCRAQWSLFKARTYHSCPPIERAKTRAMSLLRSTRRVR